MTDKPDSQPPSRADAMVDPCVKRCLNSEQPLAALSELLDVFAIDPTWTVVELAELRRRIISVLVDDTEIVDDPPRPPPKRPR